MSGYNLGEAKGRIVLETDFSSLSEAEQALKNFQGAGQKTADSANQQSEAVKKSLNSSANAAGAAGVTIAAGFGYAIKSASDFQFTMSQVQAVSGASSAQMDQISKAALRIGADTTFSADQAGQAFEELVKAGVSVEDALGGAADATVALAAAGQIDLPNAAAIASNAMNQFNLAAEDLPNVANKIAGAANASAIDVSDFGQSISQVGAVANLVGASFDDTAAAIALMGNAGIKGSDAGTSLKTMLMNLTPSTKEAREEMMELGIITADGTNKFYDAEGSLKSLSSVSDTLKTALKGMSKEQQQAALTTLFGADAIRGAAILANNGAEGFNNMADAMGKVSAADVASARMSNLQGAMEALSGSVETTAILVGTPLLNAMTSVVNAINTAVDAFSQLDSGTRNIITAAAGATGGLLLLFAAAVKIGLAVSAARATLLAATGATTVYGAAGALAAARMKIFAAAQAILNAVLRRSPLIAIVAVIALLVAGFMRLYNSSKPLQAAVSSLGAAFMAVFGALSPIFDAVGAALGRVGAALTGQLAAGTDAAGQGILGFLVPAITAFATLLTSLVPSITAFATQVATAIGGIATTAGPALGGLAATLAPVLGSLVATLASVFSQVAGVAGPVLASLATTVASLAPYFSQLASVILSSLGAALTTILPVIGQLAATITGQLVPVLAGVLSAVIPPLAAAIVSLVPVFAQVVGAVASVAGILLASLVPALVQILAAVLPVVTTLVSQLVPVFAQIVAAVVPLVTMLLSALVPAFAQILASVLPVVTLIIGQLVPVFAQLISVILPIVAVIVGQLIPVFAQIIAAVMPLVSTLIGTLMPIFAQIIAAIAPLIATILGALIPVFNEIANVVSTVMSAIVPIIEAAMQIIQGVINVVMGVISGNWSQVWTGIQQIVSGILNAIVGVITGAFNIVKSIITGAVNIVRSVVSGAFNAVAALISGAVRAAAATTTAQFNAIVNAVRSMASAVGAGIANVISFFSGLGSRIMGAVSSFGGLLVSVGRNLMQGFINGVSGFADRMISAVTAPISGAINAAKGLLGIHSPSRVFHDIGENVQKGLINGLKTRRKEIAAMASRNADIIGTAFERGEISERVARVLFNANAAMNRGLQPLAAQAEKLVDRVAKAQKKLSDLQKERSKYAQTVSEGITKSVDASDQASAKGYIVNLQQQIKDTKEFSAALAKLKKAGIDKSTYSELAAGGTDSLYMANSLLAGGKAAIKQVASLRNQLNKSANTLGNTAASGMYDAGIQSAKGLLKGLQSQQSSLTRQMQRMASAMVNQIKRELKIHSPSRVFEDEVGAMIPAGAEKGITGNLKALMASGRTLVQSLMQGVASQYPDLQSQLNDVASLLPADVRQTITNNVEANRAQQPASGNTFVQNNTIYTDDDPVLWARATGREYEKQMIGVPA